MDQITNEQALEVIKDMIERRKMKHNQTGFYHLLWGILISCAIVAMYVLVGSGLDHLIVYSWAIFVVGGAVASFVYAKRTYEKQGSSKDLDLGLSSIWIGTMIAMFFVAFIFPILNAYKWHVIYTMVCLLIGIANISTGILIKQKISLFNGILWWIGSILFLIIRNELVFMGVFVLLLVVNNIIPGFHLYNLARKQNGN
ncbi:MAG: hypothetical protein P9M11_09295 [Candidatus Tenebribacter burtonii]|nr:hypothetical protein [Candidatus Tenebribacter burtonii]